MSQAGHRAMRRIAKGLFVLGLVAAPWVMAGNAVGLFMEATDRLEVVLWAVAVVVDFVAAAGATLLVAYVLGERSEASRDTGEPRA